MNSGLGIMNGAVGREGKRLELVIAGTCDGSVDGAGLLNFCAAFLGIGGNFREIRYLRRLMVVHFAARSAGSKTRLGMGEDVEFVRVSAADRAVRAPIEVCRVFLFMAKIWFWFGSGHREGQAYTRRVCSFFSGMNGKPFGGFLFSHVAFSKAR
jgi:hypothetical protein